MSTPTSTIAVIGREAFSPTPETVRRIVGYTPAPIRLVVVDGGSPPAIRDRLEALARAHDFTLVRHDAPLTANEARNLALTHADTEFVAFVDNDTRVDAGWLEGLERCARETGAAAVSPIVLWGPIGCEEVHFAGASVTSTRRPARDGSWTATRACTNRWRSWPGSPASQWS